MEEEPTIPTDPIQAFNLKIKCHTKKIKRKKVNKDRSNMYLLKTKLNPDLSRPQFVCKVRIDLKIICGGDDFRIWHFI